MRGGGEKSYKRLARGRPCAVYCGSGVRVRQDTSPAPRVQGRRAISCCQLHALRYVNTACFTYSHNNLIIVKLYIKYALLFFKYILK